MLKKFLPSKKKKEKKKRIKTPSTLIAMSETRELSEIKLFFFLKPNCRTIGPLFHWRNFKPFFPVNFKTSNTFGVRIAGHLATKNEDPMICGDCTYSDVHQLS